MKRTWVKESELRLATDEDTQRLSQKECEQLLKLGEYAIRCHFVGEQEAIARCRLWMTEVEKRLKTLIQN